MNERINELAEQTRKYADENRPGSFVKYDPEWFVLYNEKFAELIVRECADIGNNAYSDVGNYTYIGDKIKQHFGVEQ
jgi:hypothetical protein